MSEETAENTSETPRIHKLAGTRYSVNASCADGLVSWQNPQSTGLLLSNDVPCTDAHLHYTTNALFRWGWQLLTSHLKAQAADAQRFA